MNVKKYNIVLYCVLFTPYITFGLFESDLSPFYILIVFFCIGKIVAKDIKFFCFYTLLLFILTLVSWNLNNTLDIRILKFLASILLIYVVFRLGEEYKDVFPKVNWTNVALCWLLVGLVGIIDPKLFDTLLYRVGHTSGRGSPGLTAEPSLYGLNGVFLYFLVNKYSEKILPRFFIIISIFLSASAYAFCILFMLLITNKHYKMISFHIIFAILAVIFIDINIRLLNLVTDLLTLDLEKIMNDVSIAFRFSNFIYIYQTTFGVEDKVSSLKSSFTILFYVYGVISYLIIMLLFYMHNGLREFLLQSLSVSSFVVFIVIVVIGPLAIPTLWLFIGANSENTSNNAG